MEFMGYVRPDGKVGARNYVAVIPSVTCANDVANAICHQVQGTITYLHHQGCCQMPRSGARDRYADQPGHEPQRWRHPDRKPWL